MRSGLKDIQEPPGKLIIELEPTPRLVRTQTTSARKPPAPKLPSTGSEVFLCYRRTDSDFASLIGDMLGQEGLAVWMDRIDILPGRRWKGEIRKAITRSRVALVLIGHSGVGPFQENEIGYILERELEGLLSVIPVILPGVEDEQIPPCLEDFQFVDYRRDKDPFGRLVKAVKAHLAE